MSHLTPEQLLDVAEHTLPADALPHLEDCTACRRTLGELRDALAVAVDADVPDPSPLFWSHLSARVRDAVAAEPTPGGRTAAWWAPGAYWRLAAALATVGVVTWGVVVGLPNGTAPAPPPLAVAESAPRAPDDLVPFDEDPALAALADLTSELDWDAASEAGLVPASGAVDSLVQAMDEEERIALRQVLQEALGGSGA